MPQAANLNMLFIMQVPAEFGRSRSNAAEIKSGKYRSSGAPTLGWGHGWRPETRPFPHELTYYIIWLLLVYRIIDPSSPVF